MKNINLHIITTKNQYNNNDVYMSKCCICGSNEILHSHHIEEQSNADKDGYIGTIHKNIKGNIAVLCDKCHHDLHSNNKEIVIQNTPSTSILTISE